MSRIVLSFKRSFHVLAFDVFDRLQRQQALITGKLVYSIRSNHLRINEVTENSEDITYDFNLKILCLALTTDRKMPEVRYSWKNCSERYLNRSKQIINL